MKPTSTFKMPKSVKTMIDKYKDPHLRGSVKRDYIKALLESSVKPRTKEDKNKEID